MSVLTATADEFPLLAAIAHELGEAHDGNKVARLRTAKRLLQDAFRSIDRTQGYRFGPLDQPTHRWSESRGREVMNDARRKTKTAVVQG